MIKFEVGKTYTMFSPCDQNCTWTYTVVKRTACFVTLQDDHGKETRHRISKAYSEANGHEVVLPLGSYSMNPELHADCAVEAPVEQAPAEQTPAEQTPAEQEKAMYGVYVKYVNGYRQRLGVSRWNQKGSNIIKVYAKWDDQEAAQKCADLLMARNSAIVSAVVKQCKK